MKNALAPQLNQDFVFKATGTSPIIDIRGRGLGFFKIAYINNGVTAPSAGTIVLQKSSDGVTWSTGITATCTSDGQSLITAIDTSFLRLNLSTYTRASDSSLLVNIVGYITDPTLGSGDIVGPAIAIDSHIALFDGTSGNLLKDGGALPAVAIPLTYLDTDGTLAANSDVKVASEKAVKTYVDANAGGVVTAPAGEILYGTGTGITSNPILKFNTTDGFSIINTQGENQFDYGRGGTVNIVYPFVNNGYAFRIQANLPAMSMFAGTVKGAYFTNSASSGTVGNSIVLDLFQNVDIISGDAIILNIQESNETSSLNSYGIKIGDVAHGTTANYAIKTGLGLVEFGDVVKATGYKSSDGSLGTTGTITTASLIGKTVTIKNGLITSIA